MAEEGKGRFWIAIGAIGSLLAGLAATAALFLTRGEPAVVSDRVAGAQFTIYAAAHPTLATTAQAVIAHVEGQGADVHVRLATDDEALRSFCEGRLHVVLASRLMTDAEVRHCFEAGTLWAAHRLPNHAPGFVLYNTGAARRFPSICAFFAVAANLAGYCDD